MALRLQGQTAPPEPAAVYVPGPQNAEERHTLAFLNAVTAEALPEFEWHRLGPGWKAYYHLLLRELPGPESDFERKLQEQSPYAALARASRMGDDTFRRLSRALKFPSQTKSAEIIAKGGAALTLQFADATAPWEKDGLRQPCVDSGHPFVHNGVMHYLPATQPIDLGGEVFNVATGNLLYLATGWETLRQAVDDEFACVAR